MAARCHAPAFEQQKLGPVPALVEEAVRPLLGGRQTEFVGVERPCPVQVAAGNSSAVSRSGQHWSPPDIVCSGVAGAEVLAVGRASELLGHEPGEQEHGTAWPM